MSYYDDRRQVRRQKRRSVFSGMKLRLMIGAGIVLFSLFRFYSKGQTNPITGKSQRVDMTIDQEIRMGSKALRKWASRRPTLAQSACGRSRHAIGHST